MVSLLKGETDSHRDSIHAEICYPVIINKYRDPVKFVEEWKKTENPDRRGISFLKVLESY